MVKAPIWTKLYGKNNYPFPFELINLRRRKTARSIAMIIMAYFFLDGLTDLLDWT